MLISTRIPKEFPKNSQRIPKEFPKNPQRIPKEFPNLCTANYEVINKFELAIQGS